MKHTHTLLALMLLVSTTAFSQNIALNTDGSTPDGSAALHIKSTTRGLLIPVMTASQKADISQPATGLMIYQTDGTAGFYYNKGTAGSPNWVLLLNGTDALPAISGANLTNLNASNLSSGTVGTARLGSGTANNTTYLRGDGSWIAPTFGATQLSGLSDISSATKTSGHILVADGTNFGSVALSGDATLDSTGSLTIADNAITGSKIGAGAVTSAKISDGTIANADIASNAAIAYSKLNLSSSIVAGDISSNAVTTNKIQDNSVTYSKLSLSDGDIPTAKVTGIGSLSSLTTIAKGSLVAAINEVNSNVSSANSLLGNTSLSGVTPLGATAPTTVTEGLVTITNNIGTSALNSV